MLGASTVASASITAFWRQNTITPAAISADPALANMQSWSLMTTTTGNWIGAGMSVFLFPQGVGHVYYNPAQGINTRPSSATVAAFPNVEFDTYVSSPGDQGGGVGAPAILGGHYGSPVADFGGITGLFDVAWGDLTADPPGTFEIARLTFPSNSIASVSPGGGTAQSTPDSTATIPTIPEPSAGGVFVVAGLLALRFR
jgi:hypothetical protein